MVSLDIENLFTNVPVHETMEIILDNFFADSTSSMSISRPIFKEFLRLAVQSSFFIFNGQLYRVFLSRGDISHRNIINITNFTLF